MRGIVGTEFITILRDVLVGENDAYGNPLTVVEEEDVEGVLVAPGNHQTTVDNTGFETENIYTFYLPKSIKIDFKNSILYNGGRYEIVTTPTVWTAPKGSPLKTKTVVVAKLTRLGEKYGV